MKTTLATIHPATAIALFAMALGALLTPGRVEAQEPPAEAAASVDAQDPPVEAAAPAEAPRQVRVEVRLLEWQLNDLRDFDFAVLFSGETAGGILDSTDLTLPSSSPLSSAARIFLSGMDAGSGSFDMVIEALESVAEVKTISQPDVILTVGEGGDLTSSKEEDRSPAGSVSSTQRIPFETVSVFGATLAVTTEYRDAGVVLEVNAPEIKYGNLIHLHLSIKVTDQTGTINIGANRDNEPSPVPVLNTREINHELMVKDGSLLIAGFLKTSREVERRQGIPFLSEIPILRWFLSNNTRRFAWDNEYTDLVLLVRATILEPIEPRK